MGLYQDKLTFLFAGRVNRKFRVIQRIKKSAHRNERIEIYI
jgi:hypothetical protein